MKIQYVGFEVFTAVTMKNACFWDVAPCRSCVNRRFGGAYRLHLQGRKIRERETSVSNLIATENRASVVKGMCLLIPCLAIDVLFLSDFACAGMCLSGRCLAMGIHVTICM
jgi:hypothetical protein